MECRRCPEPHDLRLLFFHGQLIAVRAESRSALRDREQDHGPVVGLLLLPSARMEEIQVSTKPSGSCSSSPA